MLVMRGLRDLAIWVRNWIRGHSQFGTVAARTRAEIRIKFLEPEGLQIVIQHDSTAVRTRLEQRQAATGQWEPRECLDLKAGVGGILEVRIPFGCLGAQSGLRVACLLAVMRQGAEVEQHPRHGPIEFEVPDGSFTARSWTA